MDVTLSFPIQKATYGFLYGIAKFTDDHNVLFEVLDAIYSYDLSNNLLKDGEKNGHGFDEKEHCLYDVSFTVKAAIIGNPKSTVKMHRKISNDRDHYARWNVAQFTKYHSILDEMCCRETHWEVIRALLVNPRLTESNFDELVKRLLNNEFDWKSSTDYDIKSVINDYFFTHRFIKYEQIVLIKEWMLQNRRVIEEKISQMIDALGEKKIIEDYLNLSRLFPK